MDLLTGGLGIAGSLVGGLLGNSGEKKARQAAQQAANQATGETRNALATATNFQQPYVNAGTSALAQMQALNGGDFSSFTQSPDYQFALTQGLQGLDRSAAARGGLYSGGHSADTMNYASGLASQNYDSYYNRLSQLAGMGQQSAGSLGGMNMNAASTIGNYMTGAGNARASSYQNQANNWQNTLGDVAGWAGYMWGGK